jgi:dephospho-CoA kinase
MIIGITGQTATGKSTLSNIFKKNGYLIFDADKAYNLLFTENHNMQQEILKEFNTLDKKNILKTVMHNPELLEKLNLITHKYVIIR